MLEHTVKNVPKRVFDELQLLEADSNTAEGSFERTKKYLNGKIESGELECETFFGGSGPNIVSVLAKAGVPSALFAGIGGELGLPDEIGDGIISDLSDYGVVRCLKRVEGYKSCEIFTLLHDWNEDRTFAVDLGATVALDRPSNCWNVRTATGTWHRSSPCFLPRSDFPPAPGHR